MKNINDFYNLSNSFLIDCLYCFVFLLSGPERRTRRHCRCKYESSAGCCTKNVDNGQRWHSSRKVTNDQICVSILLLMHISRFVIFSQYLWVCTQSSLTLHCRVWCPKSSFSSSNWQQFYVVNFICTTLNYQRINNRQITMSNNSLRETWEDKNYIPWA